MVAADRHGEVTASVLTGSEGAYRIDDLLPGEYTLAVSSQGFRPTAEPVTVSAEVVHRDIQIPPASSLHGTVYTRDGRAVDDARVTLLDAAGNVVATQTTGADGTYAFGDLPDAMYTVIASRYQPVAAPITLRGVQVGFDVSLSHGDA